MTLKIKDKKYLTKLLFRQFYITRKLELQGSFNGKRIRIRIRVTQKDRIRPDPDPQHCFIVFIQRLFGFLNLILK